jgi:hypothetical protein
MPRLGRDKFRVGTGWKIMLGMLSLSRQFPPSETTQMPASGSFLKRAFRRPTASVTPPRTSPHLPFPSYPLHHMIKAHSHAL